MRSTSLALLGAAAVPLAVGAYVESLPALAPHRPSPYAVLAPDTR